MTEPAGPKSLLVLVTSDPRSSHRPAEAIRLAAGVATWRKVEVTLYFAGPAVLAVSSDADDFVNEESYTHYLPMFSELGRPIFVETSSPAVSEIKRGELRYETLSHEQLASVASKMTYLLRF